MSTITIDADIDNCYPDGTVRTTVSGAEIDSPPPVDTPARQDWESDFIMELTGTGRTDRGARNAGYFVKITASSDPAALPVGTEFEFC